MPTLKSLKDGRRVYATANQQLLLQPLPRYHFEPTVYRAGFYSIKIYLQRPGGGYKRNNETMKNAVKNRDHHGITYKKMVGKGAD